MPQTRFIYIDDRPDLAVAQALGEDEVRVFRFPEDLTGKMEALLSSIRECAVIIVDLKLADHETVDASPPNAFYPKDGLALKEILASILTERASQMDNGVDALTIDVEPRTTAFVLYSGELDLLGGGAPAKGREHVIARRIRAEWVMSKNPKLRPESQIDLKVLGALAAAVDAVVSAPWDEAFEREDIVETIAKLLAVDQNAGWASIARRQIFEGRPPLQSLAEKDGISLLRWLLHLVLPYPSFLLDATEVALLCRLEPDWGGAQLAHHDTHIAKLFETSRYKGLLADFLGPRWWRAGVLATLREFVEGSLQDADSLGSRFERLYGASVPRIKLPTPVRTVDEEFRLTDVIVDVEDAVRLEPEEWPAELPSPWFPLNKLAENPRMRRYVLERDIDRVQSYLSARNDRSR